MGLGEQPGSAFPIRQDSADHLTRSSLYERVFPNRVQEIFDDVCLLKFNFWWIWCVLFAQVRSRARQVLDLVHLVRIGAREILANLTKGVSCSSFALVYLGAFG